MKNLRRIALRIACQFMGHTVTEVRSFSCQCDRCGKGWLPTTWFAGPFTVRKLVGQFRDYYFR